jgi:recombination protein RecA
VQITEELIASGSVDIIVVDSIASLISNEDLNSSMKKQSNNNTITDTIKKLSNLMYKSNCALVLINQIRNDLKSTKYNSEIAIADRALNTYASVRLDVRQTNELHKYDQIIGAKVKITIKKNKLALKKGNDVVVKHYYDSGIDIIDDLLELACNAEIVSRTGSWYTYDKIKLQGKPSMKNYLIRNEDTLDDIFERVLNHYFKD